MAKMCSPVSYKSVKRRWVIIGLLCCGFLTVVLGMILKDRGTAPSVPVNALANSGVLTVSTAGGYTGSASCRECHPKQFSSWHRSYHRTMTQLATPESVVGSFQGERLDFQGQTYRVEREGDRYFVSSQSTEARPHLGNGNTSTVHNRRQIVMTTGSHHIQVYWISDPSTDRIIEFPYYYHIAEGRWILRDDTMLHPPGQPQFPSIWNDRCIKCHSVNGVPGFDPSRNSFSTNVAELGIACEACHGPGEKHIAFHRNVTGEPEPTIDDSLIVNPRKLEPKAAAQVCGRCHSASTPHDQQQYLASGLSFHPGDELGEFVSLNAFDPDRERPMISGQNSLFIEDYPTDGYWKDGTCRVGGDEYNALIESPCYQKGQLTCISCHSMHAGTRSDQLSEIGLKNSACTQCHEETRFNEQLKLHTHHANHSAGSSCYNCHMPHTSYALLTAMRSHRIDSPSVAIDVEFGKPNACNLCHLDRTLHWTSQYLQLWYQMPESELDTDTTTIAASVLWLLRGNAALRIIAAWHMGWSPALEASGNEWQGAYLASLLNDSYAAIRFVTAKALKNLPGFEQFEYDFIGSSEERDRSAAAAMRIWKETRPERAAAAGTPLLIDSAGNFQTEIIDRLLRQRDNRPVSIAE